MAIGAPHDALFQLAGNPLPGKHRNHAADVEFLFAVNVVQFKNDSIGFAAIDATFIGKVLKEALAISLSPQGLVFALMLAISFAVPAIVITIPFATALLAIASVRTVRIAPNVKLE